MMRGVAPACALTLVLAEMHAYAQPPDFSGTWALTDPKTPGIPPCAKSFKATQDQTTLSLDFGASSRLVVYRFDGTDTTEALPPAPPRPPEMPPTAWIAHAVASVARAAWNGDQLIIVTHRTMKMTWPDMMPDAFDRQHTFRDALSLDANGHLVIDRTIIIDPLPGNTKVRLDFPTSWNCTYSKVTRADH